MKAKKRILSGILLAVLLAGCSVQEPQPAPQLQEPVGLAPDTATAYVGEIYNMVRYDSKVVPYVQELYFSADGVIAQVYCYPGMQVQAGDILAELDLSHVQTQIAELEGKLAGVNNYSLAVQEKGDTILFLRKIIRGSAGQSYGIQVAKLAGVPDQVIDRAKEIVKELEQTDITQHIKKIGRKERTEDPVQLSLFDTMNIMTVEEKESEVEKALKEADLSNMTPIQALNLLYELQKML